ncbi:zinc finger, CCHC-type, retrotransposon gag domain protein [Tanacetum coccineum]|uniref:Zinc finger, CCHC-type, retrotransposon gag domain protein n=1 Tax=Tanacetum coccineum TaxID=301880 RepID=A0ABQ5H080_9ASTR
MVNTRTDAELAAAVQAAVDAMLPQIREQVREEYRTGAVASGSNPPPVTIHTWLERFNKQKPRSFEKAVAPVDAENWISHMEKIFDVMDCNDAFKTRLAVYKFEGDALAWWKAYKQAKGGDAWVLTLTWAAFKELFFLQFFPRAEQERLKREYHSIRQRMGLVRAWKTVRLKPPMSPSREDHIGCSTTAALHTTITTNHLHYLPMGHLIYPRFFLPHILVSSHHYPYHHNTVDVPSNVRKRMRWVGVCATAAPRPIGGHGIDYGFIGTLDAKTRRQRAEEVGYRIRDVWVDRHRIGRTQLFQRVDWIGSEDSSFTIGCTTVGSGGPWDNYQQHWDKFRHFRLEVRLMQMIARVLVVLPSVDTSMSTICHQGDPLLLQGLLLLLRLLPPMTPEELKLKKLQRLKLKDFSLSKT